MANLLVTGGAGFVGANLHMAMQRADLAEEIGHQIDALSMPARPGMGSKAA